MNNTTAANTTTTEGTTTMNEFTPYYGPAHAPASVAFYAAEDGKGKWHAKRLVTGEADCGAPVILGATDRIHATKDAIKAGTIHPIICRRCARLNGPGATSQRIVG